MKKRSDFALSINLDLGFLGPLMSTAATAGFVLVAVLWGGYIASLLWGWFLVPLGVPAIGYWHAVGIETLLGAFGLFSRKTQPDADDSPLSIVKMALWPFVMPLVFLAVGAVAHWRM